MKKITKQKHMKNKKYCNKQSNKGDKLIKYIQIIYFIIKIVKEILIK